LSPPFYDSRKNRCSGKEVQWKRALCKMIGAFAHADASRASCCQRPISPAMTAQRMDHVTVAGARLSLQLRKRAGNVAHAPMLYDLAVANAENIA
jgi:hypothetical protein